MARRAPAQAVHGGGGATAGVSAGGASGLPRRRLRDRRYARAPDQAGDYHRRRVLRARHAQPTLHRRLHPAARGGRAGARGGHGRDGRLGARLRGNGAGGGHGRGASHRARESDPLRRGRRVRRVRGVPLARSRAGRVPGAAAHDRVLPPARPAAPARLGLRVGPPDRGPDPAAGARHAPGAGRGLQRGNRRPSRRRDRDAVAGVPESGGGPQGGGEARRIHDVRFGGLAHRAAQERPAVARGCRRDYAAPGHALRQPLRGEGGPRDGRDGSGIPRVRPRAAGSGGDQDAPSGNAHRGRRRARALQTGDPAGPQDRSPQRGADARSGRGERDVLPHDGIRGGDVAEAAHRDPRPAAGARHPHDRQTAVPGARSRPRARRDPSRHQAPEHGGRAERRAQGDGLRHRPAREPVKRGGVAQGRNVDRHAGLHAARAALGVGAGRAQRPLLGGRGVVRVSHAPPAVRGGYDIRADREADRGDAARSANPQSGRARSARAADSQGDGEGAKRQVSRCGGDARCACGDRMTMGPRMQTLRVVLITLFTTGWLAAQQAAPAPRPYRPGVDVLDYALSVDVPDSGTRIEGRAVLTVRRTARTDTLVLDLVSLRVDSVLVDERATRFRRDSGTIRIPLPAASSETLTVAVRYGGPVTDGLIMRNDSAWGWTAFADNWPNRGRHWIPSVDHPSDKATVSWTVRAPSRVKVIANGARLGEAPVNGSNPPRTVTRWRMNEPIPVYLMVIAAAPLYEYDLGETACGLALVARCVHQWAYVEPRLADFLPGPFRSAGDSAFRAEMEEIRRVVLSSRVVAERPVIDTAEQNPMALLNENSYQKGAFVLHMLRRTLGDSALFRGLHRYYDRYRNGNALSDDFRRELEASSGTPLGWFFDQWLRRPGFPELTTSWTYDAAAKRVILSITQAARFGSYRFPLTIDIKTVAGHRVRTRVYVAPQTSTPVTL